MGGCWLEAERESNVLREIEADLFVTARIQEPKRSAAER